MSDPKLNIVVDEDTGRWFVNSQPMVLVPRHYWVFIQMEIEKRLGIEGSKDLLYDATVRAAKLWCAREAETLGLTGPKVFEYYLNDVSRRGFGSYSILEIDPDAGEALIRLDHSVWVSEYGPGAGRNVCYVVTGALVGGMEYVSEAAGRADHKLVAEEIRCGSNGADHCRFLVSPASQEASNAA